MDSRVSRRRPNPKMSPSRISRRDPYLPEVGLWWSKSRRLMRGGTFFRRVHSFAQVSNAVSTQRVPICYLRDRESLA